MENKKTFKVIIIGLTIYMLLSWVITAGYFGTDGYVASGFNQFGLINFLLAPLELFNSFAVTLAKDIDSYVIQIGYGNIILAFLSIGILYGTLIKTGAYNSLVNDIKSKLVNKRGIFLLIISFIYCLISALTGLNLVLFMFMPFIAAILMKLKYNRVTTFTATIGSMLVGQIGSLYNPNINGLNHIMLNISQNSNLYSRIILFLMLTIILLATLFLTRDNSVEKEEEILLLADKDKKEHSYMPIVVIGVVTTVVLFICMYNWYYMFDIKNITNAYNNIIDFNIKGYSFMRNIFGMSEAFGYWTGFTMSAILLLDSLIIKFIYNIKLDKFIEGVKKGLGDMLPTIFFSIVSLTLIVVSLNDNSSFIYSIINNILNAAKNSHVIGVLSSSLLHNIFVNDYFALLSSLSSQITNIYGADTIDLTAFISQIGHGIASMLTPFSVYLIAGLTYLKVSYTSWIKYIWKTLLIIFIISIVVIYITVSFV